MAVAVEPAEDGNLSLALLLPRLLVSDRGIPQSPNAPNPLFPARARQAKRISPVKPHKTAKSVSCCWKAARFVLQKLQRRLESSWGEDTSALSPALGLCSSQSRSLCSARPNPPSSQGWRVCRCRLPLAGLGHNTPRNAETRCSSCSL